MKTVEERFWPKVKKTGDCWLWTACLDNKGYGFMKVKRGSKWKNVKAHRVSYELHNEELPEDLGILHSCRNRNCVNPEHLRAGTQKENGLDMIRDGSAAAGERNGNVRLTKELVEEIRALYESEGGTHRALAKRYGVSRSTVWNLVNYKTWKTNE